MIYSYFGLQQQKLVEWGLDIRDAAIIRYLIDFMHSGRMTKKVFDKKDYFWVHYDTILKDMYILEMTKIHLRRLLKNYEKIGLLEHYLYREPGSNGTFSFYRFNSEKYSEMFEFDQKQATKKFKGFKPKSLSKDYILIKNDSLLPSEEESKSENSEKEFPKKELLFENSSQTTQALMSKLYEAVVKKSPKVKKEKFYDPKEVYLCQKIIKYYLKGFPKNNFSALREFFKDRFSKTIESGFFSKENIFMYFENAIKIYSPEYKPDNKKHLPNRLSSFLYNAYGKVPSYLLHYGSKEPPKINQEVILKDNFPKSFERIKGFYKHTSTEEKNGIKRFLNNLKEEHTEINQRKIIHSGKKIKREDFEDAQYLSYVYNFSTFVKLYVGFLEHFDYSGDFKKNLFAQMNISGWYWKEFIKYCKQKYQIDLFPSDKDLKIKYKRSLE